VLRRLLTPTLIALVALVAAGACSDDGGSSGDTTVPNGVKVFDLEPGDCFLNPESTDVSDVQRTECDEPHDAEVFAVFDLEFDRDADFPGASQVQSAAQEGCQAEFEGYVGQPYEESPYFLSAIAPTQRTWEGRDDREVVCSAITATGEQLDQSLRDSAAG
jgi:hypothetical protein